MRFARFLLMFASTTAAGAIDLIDPQTLHAVSHPTCIQLKNTLAFDSYQTVIFTHHWIYKLESGPYIAEKVDAKGTYYRAPPGGLSEMAAHPHKVATYDGGFYIPNDASAIVAVYEYRSNGRVPVQILSSDANCSTARYVKDPVTSKISLVAFGAGAALGGATGATIARSTLAHGKLSYGQAAGVGAAGGLVGGLIVGAIVNHEMGKMVFIPGIKDQDSLRQLRALAASKIPLKPIEIAVSPTDSRGTASAATN